MYVKEDKILIRINNKHLREVGITMIDAFKE
jgi:hypothetical protein